MLVQTSLVHTAQVRARKIAWDGREVVQHGLLSDYIALDLDAEWRECDRIQAVLAGAGEPVRILVEGGGFNIPSSLMERTGAIRMCLIGYVGETARIVTAKEAKPLTVVESGEMGGTDPAPEQPDLWAQLMDAVRKATDGAKTAAQSATRAEADLRAAAERGDFDGEDGKTPVRGVDYWTAEDREPIEDATLAATTAAGRADAAAQAATEGEASRVAAEAERADAEAARAEAEQAREGAETGRVEAEKVRVIADAERGERVDTAVQKADAATAEATEAAGKADTAATDASIAASAARQACSSMPGVTYIDFPLTRAGYISAAGSFTDTENASCSELVPVGGYDYVEANVNLSAAGCAIAFFGDGGAFTDAGSVLGESGGRHVYRAKVPASATHAVVSNWHNGDAGIGEYGRALVSIPGSTANSVDLAAALPSMRSSLEAVNGAVSIDVPLNSVKGYLHSGGYVTDSESARMTDAVYVRGFKRLTVTTKIGGAGYAIALLDSAGRIIPNLSVTGGNTWAKTDIDLADERYGSVCYAVASAFESSHDFSKFSFRCIGGEQRPVEPKRHYGTFSVIGDSYSTFKGYLAPSDAGSWYPDQYGDGLNDVRSVEQTWWHKFAERYGSRLLENVSWSGSTVAYDGYGAGASDAKATSFVERAKHLSDPELIVIFGGTNDEWAASDNHTPDFLGEYKYADWTEQDLEKFRPALAKLLDGIKREHVGAKVVFLVNDALSKSVESIHAVCAHYGVDAVDLTGIAKAHSHPTESGMDAICDQLIAAL